MFSRYLSPSVFMFQVQDLIYHTELAKGAYKEGAAGLAKNSMLREKNVLKFVRSSNVLRPGYYIGVDPRNKLVIFGIRGTHTVSDLITDIVSSSHEEVISDGFSTHFGTAEAARWFLSHELGTIKKCLDKHEVVKVIEFLDFCVIFLIYFCFYTAQFVFLSSSVRTDSFTGF